jgi:hypothetical protein
LAGKQNIFATMEKESKNLNNDKNLELQLTDDTEEEEEEKEDISTKFCSCRVCAEERKITNVLQPRKKLKIDIDLSQNVTQ